MLGDDLGEMDGLGISYKKIRFDSKLLIRKYDKENWAKLVAELPKQCLFPNNLELVRRNFILNRNSFPKRGFYSFNINGRWTQTADVYVSGPKITVELCNHFTTKLQDGTRVHMAKCGYKFELHCEDFVLIYPKNIYLDGGQLAELSNVLRKFFIQ